MQPAPIVPPEAGLLKQTSPWREQDNNNVVQDMYHNARERVATKEEEVHNNNKTQAEYHPGKDNDQEKKDEKKDKVPMEKVPMENEEKIPTRKIMRQKGGLMAASTSQKRTINA